MEVSGDAVAEVVLKAFEKWPTKRKPLTRSDGVKEWVPLSGIVAQSSTPEPTTDPKANELGRRRNFHLPGGSVCPIDI